MTEASRTCSPTTCEASPSATSSPASAVGVPPCDLPDGLTRGPCGQGLARVSLSARQARERGLLTSGIYGLHGTTSSRSAALQSCLASRLKRRFASGGSTLFKLTWKDSSTPSGRPVCLLRASAHRTSDSGCGSWPTPKREDSESTGAHRGRPDTLHSATQLSPWPTAAAARDWKGATDEKWGSNARPLNEVAALAHWPTTTTTDAKSSGALGYGGQQFMTLTDAARIAGWPTPMAGTPAQNGNNAAGNNDSSRRTVDLATGMTLSGSPAETAKRGQLNPAFSRWLMGYRAVWDDCAPTATPSSRKSPRPSSKKR